MTENSFLSEILGFLNQLGGEVDCFPLEGGTAYLPSLKGTIRIVFKQKAIFYRFPYPLPNGAFRLAGATRAPGLFFVPKKAGIKDLDLAQIEVWPAEILRIKKLVARYAPRLKDKSEDRKSLLFELECALNAWNPGDLKAFPLVERTNPLAEAAAMRKVSHFSARPYEERRLLHNSHYGRLCALETPESEKIGLTHFLAVNAALEGGVLKARYQNLKPNKPVKISAEEEAGKSFAVFSAELGSGGKLLARTPGGKRDFFEINKKALKFIDTQNAQFLGLSCGLVPFVQHSDGARAMMGGKNMKQALPLLNPELPLVCTGLEKTAAEESGRLICAENDGAVTKVVFNASAGRNIDVKYSNGIKKSLPVSGRRHVFGAFEGAAYWETPKVKEGDKFCAGQILAEGCGIVNGGLALGVNLTVAFMPWEGYTFEDGIVVNKRLVKDKILTSVHVYQLEEKISKGDKIIFKASEGTNVVYGDPLLKKECLVKSDSGKSIRKECSLNFDKRTSGTIIKVEIDESGSNESRVIFLVGEERPVEVGDKLTGRHGNKGVVSLILPEDEMPYFKVGEKVIKPDLLLNPMGVISRMNLGQILETHYAWAIKNGIKIPSLIGEPFDPGKLINTAELSKHLIKTGLDKQGKTEIFHNFNKGNPVPLGKYVVGVQYFVKLCHLSRDKMHVRAFGPNYDTITRQPPRGKQNMGGQRVGEMEVWALLAHQVPNILRELTADKADDHFGKNLLRQNSVLLKAAFAKGKSKAGVALNQAVPASTIALRAYLRCLGLELEFYADGGRLVGDNELFSGSIAAEKLQQVRIRVAETKDIKRWSSGHISIKEKYNTRPLENPKVFGETAADHWQNIGHFDLPEPVLNPLFEKNDLVNRALWFLKECIKKEKPELIDKIENLALLYYKRAKETADRASINKEIESIKKGGNAGPILRKLRESGERPHVPTKALHDAVFKGRIAAYAGKGGALEFAWGGGRGKKNKKLLTSYALLWHLADKNTFKDETLSGGLKSLFIEKVPVLPLAFRETIEDGVSDLDKLYGDVYRKAGGLQKAKADSRVYFYKALRELFVTGRVEHGRELKSISDLISEKEGFLRLEMLGKRNDVSGRAVIVPAPDLKIDQFGLPLDMALGLIGDLVPPDVLLKTSGDSEQAKGLYRKAREGDRSARAIVAGALQDYFDRAKIKFLLVRQPSLHKYNMLAFKPVLREDYCIGLPNLVCKGFNADFDGDTMAVFLPLGAEAQWEAECMLPQNHLFSDANCELMLHISQDIALGAWELTKPSAGRKKLGAALGASWAAGTADWKDGLAVLCREGGPDITEKLLEFQKLAFEAATKSSATFSFYEANELVTDIGDVSGKKDEEVGQDIQHALKKKPENSISKMVLSGARGNAEQLMQILGRKKEIFKECKSGRVLVLRPTSNYTKGLSPFEYFASARVTRMTMIDMKLSVGKAGDFTRQMVEGAYDIRISAEDCGDHTGMEFNASNFKEFGFDKFLTGRTLLSPKAANSLKKAKSVRLRSPITCKAEGGICSKCYGRLNSSGDFVTRGLPVGIIAAQSIGEKGTQASMRREGHVIDLSYLKRLIIYGRMGDTEDSDSNPKKPVSYAELLAVFLGVYGKAVSPLHLEVIFRGMSDLGLQARAKQLDRGFLAAASFRSAKKILTTAALEKQSDDLHSAKSKIIVGKLFK